MSDTISVAVLDSMQLAIDPHIIAADADHNSAVFRIISQPSSLDALACRAEIQNAAGVKTYRLVDANREFLLTNDIAIQGVGYLQLVYGDGVTTTRKTNTVSFTVLPSINAVDPSDPDFSDGLAQLQAAAFTAVQSPTPGPNPVATFLNLGGQPVGILHFPPGGGGGLDEAAANLLYVRQDGGSSMAGDLRMVSSQGVDGAIGIYVGGRQAGLFWEQGALILRRAAAGEPVVVENFNGTGRSEVVTREIGAQLYLTQAVGDARYLTVDLADLRYLPKDGGQMTGPLITQNGTSNTNPGVGIGENSSGFWRSSQYLICTAGGRTIWQGGGTVANPEMMVGVTLNMATQAIQNLADPRVGAVGAADAVNRRYVDVAFAAVPRPNARAYTATEVTISSSAQLFFDQPFPVSDNAQRTILITIHPSYAGGSPSSFYDLVYTLNLAPLVEERIAVYPTNNAFMHAPLRFAVTVIPVANAIQVQLAVRQLTGGAAPLIQVGSRADARSYVIVEEMTQ